MIKKKGVTIFTAICSIVVFYFFNKMAETYQAIPGNILEKMNKTLDHIIPATFNLSFDKNSIIAGVIGMVIVWLIYLYHIFDDKNYMDGVEHGSAQWGTKADIEPYMDKNTFENNMIFTQTEKMTLDTRQTFRNNNVLVVGGAGSGKTRFYVKPNLMQMHSSYVVTDPKGEIFKTCGKMLQDAGYNIKVLNLINMEQSDFYNPLEYIRDEKDILKLINNLVANTNPINSSSNGDFWEKSEKALLLALFSYVFYEAPPDERNIGTVLDMLRLAEVKEDDDEFQSALDIMFEELKQENPDHFACKQYDIFKLAAGKTAKSILVSLGVRLAPFFIPALSNLMARDTIELDMVGSKKTALFVIIPDGDKTFNFMAAIMYQQLFDALYYKADNKYEGRLPIHVRFLLDEFANIGHIPDFQVYIATMRGREISVNVVLQNLSQLKDAYKDSWETITGNCDTLLFLGGKEQSTLKYISEMIGKATVDNRNITESKGQTGGYSLNHQILGRDLITPSEVGLLADKECILSIRGVKPFKSLKFDIEKHSKYKRLADFDKRNSYNFSKRKQQEQDDFFSDVDQIVELNSIV